MAKPNSNGLLEKTLFQLINKNLVNVIYDIGANKGDWTSKYAKKLPGIEFHMFEAMPGLQVPRNRGQWHNIALGNQQEHEKDFFVSPHFDSEGNSFYRENS